MNLQNELKPLLKKINAIIEDGGELSALESDLIKSYLQQAYESVQNYQGAEKSDQQATSQQRESIRAALADSRSEKIAPPISTHTDPIPVVEPEPIPQEIAKAPVIENGHSSFTKEDTLVQQLVRVTEPKEEHQALFAIDNGSDLSDRLSSQPVSNISKALSINDRLWYTSELFGGSSEAMAEAIDVLNAKPDFAEAKSFISRHLVDKYQWTDEARSECARDFIKLISRRYRT